MLLDLTKLVRMRGMHVTGVIHVGAHLAEEAETYDTLFPGAPVVWIEANPGVVPKIEKVLAAYPSQRLVQALVWEADGHMLRFNVTNYDGMSSSIYEFGTHTQFSPDTKFTHTLELETRTLDTLAEDHAFPAQCNLLNMDLQGAELPALQGAEDLIAQIDYINSEVNTDDVYVGCTKIHELDQFLGDLGFRRRDTKMVDGQGWGDALWTRRPR